MTACGRSRAWAPCSFTASASRPTKPRHWDLLARRAFRLIEDQPFAAELARKIASPLGLAEVIAVRRRLGKVEPVAQGYLSMQALAHAEGWILVPADSEGYAPGARVVVRPWP